MKLEVFSITWNQISKNPKKYLNFDLFPSFSFRLNECADSWTLIHFMNKLRPKLNTNNNCYDTTLSHHTLSILNQLMNAYLQKSAIKSPNIECNKNGTVTQVEMICSNPREATYDIHNLEIRYHFVICFLFEANGRTVRFYSVWYFEIGKGEFELCDAKKVVTCPLVWQHSTNTLHFFIYHSMDERKRQRESIQYWKMSRHKNVEWTKTKFRKVSVLHLYMCVWWDLIQNCLCGHRSFFALSFAFHSTLPNIDNCLCNEAHTRNRLKVSKHFEQKQKHQTIATITTTISIGRDDVGSRYLNLF